MRDALNYECGMGPLTYFTCFWKDAEDLATTTDPGGHTTTQMYDALSRLATQTSPPGRLTWFTYDGLGRLTRTRLYAAVEPGLLPMDATLTARAWELTA